MKINNPRRQKQLAVAVIGAVASIAATQVHAQAPNPAAANEIKNDGGFSFVNDATRLGIGVSRDFGKTKVRGDIAHAFSLTDRSAVIGEAWLGDSAGGLKVSYNFAIGDGNTGKGTPGLKLNQILKTFVALDQNRFDDRKFTFGAGVENPNWFGNVSLSTKASSKRSIGQIISSTTAQVSGTDAGRPFIEDEITTITRQLYAEPYRTGIGARVGTFLDGPLLRITGGLDFEKGRSGAKQNTVSVGLEKFFENSPHSIAFNLGRYSKSGFSNLGLSSSDLVGKKSDTTAQLMYRYTFGKPFRMEKPYRMVGKEVLIPVAAPPAPPAPVAAPVAAPPPAQRVEKRLVKTTASTSNETFFELDRAVLKPTARRSLDEIIASIKSGTYEGNIRVSGHTCNLGTDSHNDKLSKNRADAVRKYLESKGIPKDRLISEGMGERNPRYPNDERDGPKNRRVDIEWVTYVERTEDVLIPVAAPPAPVAQAPVAPPPPPPPRREIVMEKQVIDQEPAWVRRALLNPADHNRNVGYYATSETSTGTSRANRRFVNRAPNATNDSYRVACGSTTVFDVLVNDTDPDPSDPLNITIVSQPTGGTATVVGNKITYVASNCPTTANDSFTYTIRDAAGLTATATVNVTKFDATPPPPPPAPNTAPIATDDQVTTSPGVPVTIMVLMNDSDLDKDTLMIESFQQGRFGSVRQEGDKLIYTPGPQFNRAGDFFNYTIKDGKGGTATAQVRIICV